jgi:hypothetical protein
MLEPITAEDYQRMVKEAKETLRNQVSKVYAEIEDWPGYMKA